LQGTKLAVWVVRAGENRKQELGALDFFIFSNSLRTALKLTIECLLGYILQNIHGYIMVF
jgi:hypothetical protein